MATKVPPPRSVLRAWSKIGLALWDAGYDFATVALNSTTPPEPNEFDVVLGGDLTFKATGLRRRGHDPLPETRAFVLFNPPELNAGSPRPAEVQATPISAESKHPLAPGTYVAEIWAAEGDGEDRLLVRAFPMVVPVDNLVAGRRPLRAEDDADGT